MRGSRGHGHGRNGIWHGTGGTGGAESAAAGLARAAAALAGPLGLLWLLVTGVGVVLGVAAPGEHAERPAVVAHRGASGYAPENTMAAFEMAVQMGADYIELDVRMSRDGELVVMHDAAVDRTTDGSGLVHELAWRELRQLDAGAWFGSGYAGERIPSLQEVLERFAGRIGLLIELKEPAMYLGMAELAAGAIEPYLPAGTEDGAPIMLQSFDGEALRALHARLPELPIALLVSEERHAAMSGSELNDIASYATAVHYDADLLDADMVQAIRTRNLSVMAWTIRETETLQAVLRLGIDGVITDYPDW
jgi:glycerophosphoryl diester phosphodiesterase